MRLEQHVRAPASILIPSQNRDDVGQSTIVANVAREHHTRNLEREDICLERAEEADETGKELSRHLGTAKPEALG